IASGMPVYGSTTGVGAMKYVEWSADELDTFNLGLVRAHHFGTGTPFSCNIVRNAMAILINTALTGQVGCTPELIQQADIRTADRAGTAHDRDEIGLEHPD
ncbi:aromatic amino acid lyase, partial [Rhizobium leguminosarum]|uniref:aromatic amino acid lyase n=1 Tax=Rhizobium leguminosarum TaxID=384 RepID=UPI003F9E9671